MYHVSNNWQPTATLKNLELRAKLNAKIRDFFKERHILEVETPLLSASTNPAVHLNSFKTSFCLPGETCGQDFYLQTSPEFAMKRLLAANNADIYQICKAFRNSEIGRMHNPEFTILEWYRIGFDHLKLMAEVSLLLKNIFAVKDVKYLSYQEVFEEFLEINPHASSIAELKEIAHKCNLEVIGSVDSLDTWRELLFTHLIEPKLAPQSPVFIYDFPSSQAMLAKIKPGNPPLAERFEVYFKGVELANGFHELNSAKEQRERFLQDLRLRKEANLPTIPIDENFLAALPNLPDCAGIAFGLDRLLMLLGEANSLAEVISFAIENA